MSGKREKETDGKEEITVGRRATNGPGAQWKRGIRAAPMRRGRERERERESARERE